ncbi:hypothetical protein AB0E08_21455 [Streptomyces sp. NPDC048281]|uniref:hypothetical protein n=1 Tax=Streptomyces sp. NPDC048281 TaxID=3154715 RepID=UPI003447BFB2
MTATPNSTETIPDPAGTAKPDSDDAGQAAVTEAPAAFVMLAPAGSVGVCAMNGECS